MRSRYVLVAIFLISFCSFSNFFSRCRRCASVRIKLSGTDDDEEDEEEATGGFPAALCCAVVVGTGFLTLLLDDDDDDEPFNFNLPPITVALFATGFELLLMLG